MDGGPQEKADWLLLNYSSILLPFPHLLFVFRWYWPLFWTIRIDPSEYIILLLILWMLLLLLLLSDDTCYFMTLLFDIGRTTHYYWLRTGHAPARPTDVPMTDGIIIRRVPFPTNDLPLWLVNGNMTFRYWLMNNVTRTTWIRYYWRIPQTWWYCQRGSYWWPPFPLTLLSRPILLPMTDSYWCVITGSIQY